MCIFGITRGAKFCYQVLSLFVNEDDYSFMVCLGLSSYCIIHVQIVVCDSFLLVVSFRIVLVGPI